MRLGGMIAFCSSRNWQHAGADAAATLLTRLESVLLALGAGAEMVPDDDENHRGGQDEGGDGVYFGSNAAAETAPDFERECVVTPYEEKGYGDFVHRESENQQAGGDKREAEVGQSDEPEGAPGSGAEVEGGFFLAAIHFLQAGKNFGGGHGNKRGAVAQKDEREAALKTGEDSEHQHGKPRDDSGENEGEEDKPAKEGFAGEGCAVEGKCGKEAKR